MPEQALLPAPHLRIIITFGYSKDNSEGDLYKRLNGLYHTATNYLILLLAIRFTPVPIKSLTIISFISTGAVTLSL